MRPRLVLIGMGHSHLFVLEALAKTRLPPCEVVVCTAEAAHVYSGMVPGWLAGQYSADEISFDVAQLCTAVGARWIPQHVTGIDTKERAVQLHDGSHLSFDVCSIAVGSIPVGVSLPGVREHAVAIKPLSNTERLAERFDIVAREGGAVTIVGSGLAGVEIALALRSRGRAHHEQSRITLVSADESFSGDRGPAMRRALARACDRHGIGRRFGAQVRAVEAGTVQLASGENVQSELTVWATGASAAPWLANSGLPTDRDGYVRVDAKLQVVDVTGVFAAGDCASLGWAPHVAKAGVYAVRMGPVLVRSIAAALRGELPVLEFKPQHRWLSLVRTENSKALASWGPFVFHARWAMWLKHSIDRRFMRRFRALSLYRPPDVSR